MPAKRSEKMPPKTAKIMVQMLGNKKTPYDSVCHRRIFYADCDDNFDGSVVFVGVGEPDFWRRKRRERRV
jgi:hypothetical protein